MKKKNIVIVSIVILIGLVVLLLFGIQTFSKNTSITSNPNSYSTNILKGFEIRQFLDNDGIQTKPDTTLFYTGLTRIEFYKDNQMLLSLQAITGIGGNGICSEVYKFSDTPDDYVSGLKYQDGELKIHNLANDTHQDFSLYGRKARIANSEIFFDKFNNNSTDFKTECGLYSKYVQFPELNFTVYSSLSNTGGYENLYKVETNFKGLSETDISNFISYFKSLTSPYSYPQLRLSAFHFEEDPISISYDRSLSLNQEGKSLIVQGINGQLKITPDSKGIGLEELTPEITEEPLRSIDGSDFKLAEKAVIKIKLKDKITNEESFVVNLPYPNKNSSLLFNYEFKDGVIDEKLNRLFDEIVISTRFNI